MATTAKITAQKKTTVTKSVPKEPVEIKEENTTEQDLLRQIEELKQQLAQKNEPKEEKIAYVTSQMDRPCTLIHLIECVPGLETTISVAGRDYSFSVFGEKRTFRFEVMEQIVSKYRDYFRRGIFALGDDCNNSYEEFGIDVTHYPMSVEQYRKMESIPTDEFSKIVNSMNFEQRVQLAHTWTQRYSQNKDNYDNLEKIKVLNDAADGLLKDFIIQITTK